MKIEQVWLPRIDEGLCTGCGDCVFACPTQALTVRSGAASLIEPQACDYCALCERICPVQAIAIPYQIVVGPGVKP